MEGRREPVGPNTAGGGTILAVAVLLVVGIVALWLGAGGLWTQVSLLANGLCTTGTVEATRWGDSLRPARFVRVAFTDGTGTVRHAEFTVPGGLETEPGSPLTLRYDPGDPSLAAYDGTGWEAEQMLPRLVMILVGIGALGFGLGIVESALRRSVT